MVFTKTFRYKCILRPIEYFNSYNVYEFSEMLKKSFTKKLLQRDVRIQVHFSADYTIKKPLFLYSLSVIYNHTFLLPSITPSNFIGCSIYVPLLI